MYPNSLEELATYIKKGKNVFFFTVDRCGDCHFIKPVILEIKEVFPAFQFIEVDRDQSIDVVVEWNIFGIPSFIIIENDQELGRLVNKDQKIREEISAFLTSLD